MTGWWFSPGTPVSSTNKADQYEITDIFLKLALNTITLTLTLKLVHTLIFKNGAYENSISNLNSNFFQR
jgi:hypothetical protein